MAAGGALLAAEADRAGAAGNGQMPYQQHRSRFQEFRTLEAVTAIHLLRWTLPTYVLLNYLPAPWPP